MLPSLIVRYFVGLRLGVEGVQGEGGRKGDVVDCLHMSLGHLSLTGMSA